MLIKKIQFQNFRGFFEGNFEFKPNKNIILGPNACGKTSILEAIYYLSFCKSPRTNDVANLIRYDQEAFFISSTVERNNTTSIISIGVSKNAKKAKKNGQIVKKISDFTKEFDSIYFQPNELHSFLGYSINRRNLIDQAIFKIYPKYADFLSTYNKLSKQKSVLLQNGNLSYNDRVLLQTFNDSISKIADQITTIRSKAVDELNSILENDKISLSKQENVFIKYIPSAIDYKNAFNELFNQELSIKSLMVGIHKDDFELFINGEPIKQFGSLGQQKSALLSLKIAVVEWIKRHTNEYPVLLLDDALGELDIERQNRLFEIINPNIQTIITTTNLNEIKEDVRKGANIIEISKGE